MSTIRVLHVVTIMNLGGIETLLMNIYRAIDKNKVQFDFIVHREERGIYDDEIESLGGRIYRVPNISPKTLIKYKKQLHEFFLKHREYKIVHSHLDTLSTFVLREAKRANVPIRIAHGHAAKINLDIKAPFRVYSRMVLKKQATDYFACSFLSAKWLFGSKFVDNNNIKILKNCIDAIRFKSSITSRNEKRHELRVEDKWVIGHVGSYKYEKNHTFIIDVFKEVLERKPDAFLILCGDGELKSDIKNKVEFLNIDKRVLFLDPSKDIYEIMAVFDVLIFPSISEGLGMVVVEAQACGLPCIVSEGIPQEAIFTNMVKRVGIDKGPEFWAQQLIETENENDRPDMYYETCKAGYDVSETANWLANFYMEKNR